LRRATYRASVDAGLTQAVVTAIAELRLPRRQLHLDPFEF
jgi:hypothetical protein